jgi:hypothetical protein
MYNPYYYLPDIPEPKYWNEKTKKNTLPVVLLSALTGMETFEPNSGYITFEKQVQFEDQLHVHNGMFRGIRKADEKESKRVGNQRYTKNFWEIKKD